MVAEWRTWTGALDDGQGEGQQVSCGVGRSFQGGLRVCCWGICFHVVPPPPSRVRLVLGRAAVVPPASFFPYISCGRGWTHNLQHTAVPLQDTVQFMGTS
jgi:hypothetical protein